MADALRGSSGSGETMYNEMILRLMAEAEVEVRRWGNSLAVIVPAEVAKAEGLQPGDRAFLRILKVRRPDPRSFGLLRDRPLDAQALKERLRREHEW